MKSFDSIEQLEAYLVQDAKISTINPVRFINVETMDIWVKIKSILNRLSANIIRISDLCEDDDTAPNLILLKGKLRKVTRPTLVVPLSEYLRINNPIALKTFSDLLQLPYETGNGKLRIYIPVYRMKEILDNVPLDPRTNDCLLFLNTKREADYSLTIIQKDIDVKLYGNRIEGFKRYFKYWEENPDKPIILYTQNAIHYQDVVFSDAVQVIVSEYDLLISHYNMSTDIKREYGTEEQWHYLAKSMKEGESVENTLANIIGARYWNNELLRNWKQMDFHRKWTLWLWLHRVVKKGYLYEVVSSTKSVTELQEAVYTVIFSCLSKENYFQLYAERKELIKTLNFAPPKAFWEGHACLSPVEQLKTLTDCSQEEKESIFKVLPNVQQDDAINTLKYCYPTLYAYLQPMQIDSSIDTYFNDYRWQKVTNVVSNTFLQRVNEIADEKGERIFKFDSRNSVVDSLYRDDSVILFVDALGAEYIPLLKSIFDGTIIVGHCNIPSTTHYNNDFFQNRTVKKEDALDRSKHSNIEFPISIIKELDIVQSLKKRVDELLEDHSNVIIAADHGASRLSVLARNSKVKCKNGGTLYKYGRYCEDAKNDYSDIEGILPFDDFWVFANYDSFNQHGAPTNEIHGGASLEEMLVPIIQIFNAQEKDHNTIELLTPIVKMSLDKSVEIQFKLNKRLDNVIAIIDGQKVNCVFKDGIYIFKHAVSQKTEYKAKIISDVYIGEITYKVKKGISSNIDF